MERKTSNRIRPSVVPSPKPSLAVALTPRPEKSGLIELTTDEALFTLDDSGRWLSSRNLRTGTEFIRRQHASGWKMLLSRGGWTEFPVFDYVNHGRWTLEGSDRSMLEFDSLTGYDGAPVGIRLQMQFHLKGARLETTATIFNEGEDEVREFYFPYIGGLGDIAGDCGALVYPFWLGARLNDPARTLPPDLRWGWQFPLLYPGIASMQWMDYSSDSEGIYFGSHDASMQTTALVARRRNASGDFQTGFGKFPLISRGATWKSAPFVIQLHEGDWHEGARIYRKWADSWLETIHRAPWIDAAPALCDLFMKHQNGRIYFPYDQLPIIQKEQSEKGINLPLFIYSWYRAGHDTGYPIYEPDPAMGGEKGLRKALRDVAALDGHTFLYTQGRLIDFAGEYYQREGREACLVSETGVPYIDEYSWPIQGAITPNRRFAIGCPGSESWRERLRSQADMILELGAQGVLYDQLGGDHPYLCFSRNHEHSHPAFGFAGKSQLLKSLRERILAAKPDAAMIIELVCDRFAQYCDLLHGHMDNFQPETSTLPGFPELYRYTFPEHRITSRDAQDRHELNRAMALGLIFEYWRMIEPFEHVDRRLDSAPDQLEAKAYEEKMIKVRDYTEGLIHLRLAHPDLLIQGVFHDNEGTSATPQTVRTTRFVSRNGRDEAIVVWNQSPHPVNAVVDIQKPAAPQGRVFFNPWHVPTQESEEWSPGQTITMPGQSIAVLVFRTPVDSTGPTSIER